MVPIALDRRADSSLRCIQHLLWAKDRAGCCSQSDTIPLIKEFIDPVEEMRARGPLSSVIGAVIRTRRHGVLCPPGSKKSLQRAPECVVTLIGSGQSRRALNLSAVLQFLLYDKRR